jgi:ribonuclease P protein component
MTGKQLRYTLPRSKSLKSKLLINKLFKEGQSLVAYPLRMVYLTTDYEMNEPFLTGFSVPKKKFKHAVDRNRIKRLMRESFRLQQHNLKLSGKTVMMWVYLCKEMPRYNLIYQKMAEIIDEFNDLQARKNYRDKT